VITNLAAGIYDVKYEPRIANQNFQYQSSSRTNIQPASANGSDLQETVTLDDRFNYELVNTTTAVVDGVYAIRD